MKLQQGNVFTPVCHSVHRGGLGRHPPGQTPGQTPLARHPLGRHRPGRHAPWADPLHSACWDTVSKRVVRILLERNLVSAVA